MNRRNKHLRIKLLIHLIVDWLELSGEEWLRNRRQQHEK